LQQQNPTFFEHCCQARYPTGTPNRWQVIADFIGTRTVKEVIAKVKHVQQEGTFPLIRNF
jgi:hypothetical protein